MRAKQFSLRLECAYIWNRTKNDATRNLNFGRCIHDIPLLQWAFPYDDTVFWNRRRAAGAGGRRPAHYTRRLARDGCGNRTSGRGGHAHDHVAEPGQGRYLLVVNSGFGVQFSDDTNRAQQSIAVIDLNATPEPRVTQNVYFPTPQSANVGLAFAPVASAERSFAMYVSGGFENKAWIFRFDPRAVTTVRA